MQMRADALGLKNTPEVCSFVCSLSKTYDNQTTMIHKHTPRHVAVRIVTTV